MERSLNNGKRFIIGEEADHDNRLGEGHSDVAAKADEQGDLSPSMYEEWRRRAKITLSWGRFEMHCPR
jgi:hypothetical protein